MIRTRLAKHAGDQQAQKLLFDSETSRRAIPTRSPSGFQHPDGADRHLSIAAETLPAA